MTCKQRQWGFVISVYLKRISEAVEVDNNNDNNNNNNNNNNININNNNTRIYIAPFP